MSETDRRVSRRRTLAALGGGALVGLAGCSGVTEQSFEATPVVLPEGPREELVLAETASESETIEREGPSGNVEVSITSHAAVYQRGPARETPTLVERFASSVNETPGSGSAINALASEVGIDEAELSFIKGGVQVAGDRFSLLIPEGVRGGDGITPQQLLGLVPGAAVGGDTVTYDGDGPGAVVSGETFFPSCCYSPSDDYFPTRTYFRGDAYSPDSPDGFRVFVPNSRTSPDRRGPLRMPDEAQPVESGETVETANTVFVFAGDVIVTAGDVIDVPAERAFDAGVPVPLAGQPFGVGVLATPNAEVAGQSANPLVEMETTELLQQDATRRVLAETGLTDGDTVEWLGGPQAVVLGEGGPPETTLLGSDTEVGSFGGVVSGVDGPWAVVLGVARVTDDDHVIAVSGVTRPISTPDRAMETFSEAAASDGSPLFALTPGVGPVFPFGPFRMFVPEVMGSLERQ
ncbi:hypothetical protein DP107_15625 [Haloglomus irregulare]|jgi:hypothetical protein|uniref:Uncharacterized protein n=1 Tax=Haloglomus irregulare TaxID=2234134 RepID=A0A554MWR5_9EURY|nr:DUF6517 family protein [Haloglomus irregulare]TSD09566.1 hypothetical protein DP107_15625 [Haloglomus irregulare]